MERLIQSYTMELNDNHADINTCGVGSAAIMNCDHARD